MGKHMRSAKLRPYTMRRRAAKVDETTLRITEAAVRLHTTVGPAATSIAGVAEAAGVTRLTVYRHFPNLTSLFTACSRHWLGLHPQPDAGAWAEIGSFEPRVRAGLRWLYGWYRDVGREMFPIHRDIAAMPDPIQAGIRASNARIARDLIGDAAVDPASARRLEAAANHVVSIVTWHALTSDLGLDDGDALDLAIRFVVSAR